ncbi:hypothetical protein BT96DRAFT_951337 [Gymnopus androsaceus JB14]|uniref:Uncharacterized protein n=1 Tax=Gymnopus androsaceus JB14 TaxID=1447944 RepID=A0A6A4GD31_9AGAR|nr:hypothetical protein BT96DRAFT_951337 [Gymnopus androsaceus JB14]
MMPVLFRARLGPVKCLIGHFSSNKPYGKSSNVFRSCKIVVKLRKILQGLAGPLIFLFRAAPKSSDEVLGFGKNVRPKVRTNHEHSLKSIQQWLVWGSTVIAIFSNTFLMALSSSAVKVIQNGLKIMEELLQKAFESGEEALNKLRRKTKDVVTLADDDEDDEEEL